MTDKIQQIAKEMRDAAGDFEPWGRGVIEAFADRLEALQADAREKGEALEKFEREVRIGRESARRAQAMYARLESLAKRWEKVAETHGVRQFTGNDHLLFANELRAAIATQPAKASEATLAKAVDNWLNWFRRGDKKDALGAYGKLASAYATYIATSSQETASE